jgi:hypothetical protein
MAKNKSKLNSVKFKKITLNLDKPRNLVYDLNAFSELEELYGSIDGAMTAFENGSIKAFRAFLWAGLIYEDPDLTQKDVGRMLTMDKIDSIMAEMNNAMDVALPEVEEGKNV